MWLGKRRRSVASGQFKKTCPEPAAGSVQPCPESGRRKGHSQFCARSVLAIREHGKLATCLYGAASAEAGNAAGGFFQPTLVGRKRLKNWTKAAEKKGKGRHWQRGRSVWSAFGPLVGREDYLPVGMAEGRGCRAWPGGTWWLPVFSEKLPVLFFYASSPVLLMDMKVWLTELVSN